MAFICLYVFVTFSEILTVNGYVCPLYGVTL